MVEIMVDIGSRIREFRKANHMTQEELGKKINVSSQVISNIERGYTASNLYTIKAIAKVLNIGVEEIIGDKLTNSSDKNYATFIYENFFPDKMKKLLSEKQMDTEMLAELAGISEERVNLYLYNNKQPLAEDLIKFSRIFDVSIDYLLDNSKRKGISADEDNLLHLFNMMDDDCKKLLLSEAYVLRVRGITGVAAPNYDKYKDEEKKLYPSSGTGGLA